jgi:hypothetical protein
MTTARDRAPLLRRRLLPLTVSTAVAAALLAFAGTAFAETRVGEATSPENSKISGELDILKATATYDPAAGSAAFTITTREAPESRLEEGRPQAEYVAGLVTANFPCNQAALEAETEKAEKEGKSVTGFPIFGVFSYDLPVPGAETGPYWEYETQQETFGAGEAPENYGSASKTISGSTETLTATTSLAVNGPFNCVEVGAEPLISGVEAEPNFLLFPLTPKPEPAPVQTVAAPTTQSAPAPVTAAVLSIVKAKKPLKLKVGKWATVKTKVTNTGGTATAPGSLHVKTTKGVVVKPGRQKLPALLPDGSWTVSYRVKLTAKAKKSSTISLVGTAATLTAKSSLVLKLAGG